MYLVTCAHVIPFLPQANCVQCLSSLSYQRPKVNKDLLNISICTSIYVVGHLYKCKYLPLTGNCHQAPMKHPLLIKAKLRAVNLNYFFSLSKMNTMIYIVLKACNSLFFKRRFVKQLELGSL